jgi:hypothetical protein
LIGFIKRAGRSSEATSAIAAAVWSGKTKAGPGEASGQESGGDVFGSNPTTATETVQRGFQPSICA